MLWLIPMVQAEPAPPTAFEFTRVWGSALPYLDAHSRVPVPKLRPEHFEALAAGETVGFRQHVEGSVDGAVAVGWVPHPPEHVWLGGLDDVHGHLADGLTESWLPGTVPGHKVLYQHLDVPSPFRDRYWVVVVESNQDLYQASDGLIWERHWDLDARGEAGCLEDIDPELLPTDDHVWTPVNQGAWAVLPAGEGTMVLYQLRTDIGGGVPDELVVRYAMSTLDTMMDKMSQAAAGSPTHYVDDHFAIVRPDGSEIPTYASGL